MRWPWALFALLATTFPALAAAPFDPFTSAAIEDRLGAEAPRDGRFLDETGAPVALADYLAEGPVILAPVDFGCANICGVTLGGLFGALDAMSLDPETFTVLAVSIDPRDGTAEAEAERATQVERYDRPGAADAVHFLVGDEDAAAQLAEAIGFRYAYDSDTGQYAHAAAVAVLTPEGRLARWLYGYPFQPADIRLALSEASDGAVGTLADRLWLLCYAYDPATGAYTAAVDKALKAGGGLTVVLLGGFVALMLRRERRAGGGS